MARTPKPPTGCRIKGGRYYRVQYVGMVDGKRTQKWHALTRVAEGLPALYAALHELAAPREDTRMKPAVERWIKDALPGLSESEQKEQSRMATVIAETFIEYDATEVQAKDVFDFLQDWARDGKLRTAQRYRNALNKFFKWAIIQGIRTDNPVDPVSTPAPPPNMRHMTDEAFRLIRAKLLGNPGHKAASGEMMQVYVDLLYLTGQSGNDVRLLRWAQVDESAGVIRFARSKVAKKTAAQVDYPITPAIARVLARAKTLMKGKALLSPYVIHNLEGEPYSAHGVNTAWKRARERAFADHQNMPEIKAYTLKDLRAKHATDAKARGYTTEQIGDGLAHADVGMTTTYLKKRMAKRASVELEIPE